MHAVVDWHSSESIAAHGPLQLSVQPFLVACSHLKHQCYIVRLSLKQFVEIIYGHVGIGIVYACVYIERNIQVVKEIAEKEKNQ